ncbi:hypothetical protein [Actinocatenispora rupis]|nr:hypothetical protein [Actinocatenispora rupis]
MTASSQTARTAPAHRSPLAAPARRRAVPDGTQYRRRLPLPRSRARAVGTDRNRHDMAQLRRVFGVATHF